MRNNQIEFCYTIFLIIDHSCDQEQQKKRPRISFFVRVRITTLPLFLFKWSEKNG